MILKSQFFLVGQLSFIFSCSHGIVLDAPLMFSFHAVLLFRNIPENVLTITCMLSREWQLQVRSHRKVKQFYLVFFICFNFVYL